MSPAPFLLAAFFGLLISALLYFVLVWPSREPPDDGDAGDAGDEATGPGVVDRPAGKRAGKHAPRRSAAAHNAT